MRQTSYVADHASDPLWVLWHPDPATTHGASSAVLYAEVVPTGAPADATPTESAEGRMTFPAPDPLARHARAGCNAPLVLLTETRLVMDSLWHPPHWQPMIVERCGH